MSILIDFRKSDFIERTKILAQIEKEKKIEEIPGLFELHENPLNDQAIDSMVTHTLRSLLSQNEEETVKGIQSEKIKVKKLSVHMAGEARFPSAVPILIDLVSREKDPDILFEVLSALSKTRSMESLVFFRKNALHPEQAIASLCIETLGVLDDFSSLSLFTKIIEEGENEDKYEDCDLLTWNAITAVASLRSDAAFSYLVSKLNHKSPGARRVIHQEIAKKGRGAIPFLGQVFLEEDVDARIHAAQLLGQIQDTKAGEVLIGALASGAADHPNIKYTVYESLGKIPVTKGIDSLLKGLSEEDEMVLLAVISSLNKRVDSKISDKLSEIIKVGGAQAERVINSIVISKALNIFEALYENKPVLEKILLAIPRTKDPVVLTAFRFKLKSMKSGKPVEEMDKTPATLVKKTGKRILAVDDSRLLLFFYRSAATKLDLDITTAINGQEALEILEKGEEFDLIVTDLNMPVMDGIELTRMVRANPAIGKIPILMATTESKQSQMDLAKKVGVDHFIQKPFSQEVFQKKIQGLL